MCGSERRRRWLSAWRQQVQCDAALPAQPVWPHMERSAAWRSGLVAPLGERACDKAQHSACGCVVDALRMGKMPVPLSPADRSGTLGIETVCCGRVGPLGTLLPLRCAETL